MAERCHAIAKSGKPCGATVVADGMCAWHAPSWEARRRQWSAEGGRKRSNLARARKAMPPALSSEELLIALSQAIRRVEAGEFEPRPANAMASLARAMNAIRETSEVEARLAELEARAGLAGIA